MRRRANYLVLVSVVLVCGLLLVAGIARFREVAARTRCQDNLQVLGLAIFNYQSASPMDQFPKATMSATNLPTEQRLSYLVELLPYVEAAPRPPYDKTKPWDAEENRARSFRYDDKFGGQRETSWGHYKRWLCPAMSYEPVDGRFSVTHFVGIAGIGKDAASRTADSPAIGIFGYDRPLSPKDIKNDRSNTLMAIETVRDNGPWVASGYPTVRGLDPDGIPYLGKGGQFGGIHKGGTNALFSDGSVRFLTDDTDRITFESMSVTVPNEPQSHRVWPSENHLRADRRRFE